jgi:hypothetical protein
LSLLSLTAMRYSFHGSSTVLRQQRNHSEDK